MRSVVTVLQQLLYKNGICTTKKVLLNILFSIIGPGLDIITTLYFRQLHQQEPCLVIAIETLSFLQSKDDNNPENFSLVVNRVQFELSELYPIKDYFQEIFVKLQSQVQTSDLGLGVELVLPLSKQQEQQEEQQEEQEEEPPPKVLLGV